MLSDKLDFKIFKGYPSDTKTYIIPAKSGTIANKQISKITIDNFSEGIFDGMDSTDLFI